jgi:hypothetical protein
MLLVALVACDKKDDASATTAPSATPSAAASGAPAASAPTPGPQGEEARRRELAERGGEDGGRVGREEHPGGGREERPGGRDHGPK